MNVSGITSNNLLNQVLPSTASSANTGTNPLEANGANQFNQILQGLSSDIQSGNLQNAQQDLTKLQQALHDINQIQSHHHHRHHAKGNSQTASQQTAAESLSVSQLQPASNATLTAVNAMSQSQAASTTA